MIQDGLPISKWCITSLGTQCLGSGSGSVLDPLLFAPWIRIRIRQKNTDPDPDPGHLNLQHCYSKPAYCHGTYHGDGVATGCHKIFVQNGLKKSLNLRKTDQPNKIYILKVKN